MSEQPTPPVRARSQRERSRGERQELPIDHPLLLPAVLLAGCVWFGYDGWLNDDPEMQEHAAFNRIGFAVLVLLSLWYGVKGLRELRSRRAADDDTTHPMEDPPMASKAETALELFRKQIGSEQIGDWFQVDQKRIDAFADATLDHQFIHVDPEKCREMSPYKVPIAHGFLTLSLVVHLGKSVPREDPKAYEGVVMGVNYGLDRVRFPSPVKVDSRVRSRRKLLEAELKAPNTLQLKQQVTVEIQGEDKPGCVAETLTRLVYA